MVKRSKASLDCPHRPGGLQFESHRCHGLSLSLLLPFAFIITNYILLLEQGRDAFVIEMARWNWSGNTRIEI